MKINSYCPFGLTLQVLKCKNNCQILKTAVCAYSGQGWVYKVCAMRLYSNPVKKVCCICVFYKDILLTV